MTQLIKNNTQFAGYTVISKLSTRRDGEREVYLAKPQAVIDGTYEDSEAFYAVLTVFNLKSERYAQDGTSRKRVPDFIEEVKFLRPIERRGSFPPMIGCGIEKVGKQRLAWMAQTNIKGCTLSDEIRLRRGLCIGDVVKVMEVLFSSVEEIARFTKGGGHYNITPDNVLLDYDGDTLNRVYLVGLADIGPSYHGSIPFSQVGAETRFMAPETMNGVFSNKTDIYSLGMLMTMMITGTMNPDAGCGRIMGDGSNNCFNGIDCNGMTPSGFRKLYMSCVRDKLSAAQRLILEKATEPNPASRFQSIDKFRSFVSKLAKGRISTQTHIERTNVPDAGNNRTALSEEKERRFEQYGHDAAENANAQEAAKITIRQGLDEVAGMDELKDLFRRNFVRIVRNPKIAKAYGITPCNCTLLYGPQGCGKTFIAEKAAQESGLKYKIVNPSDLGSIYIHGSQEKIAETFREAEKNAPMILIFDEFDAIAPKRDGNINPHQANEVNELLTRLNNCAEKGVYVLATTNRPQMLDTAVLRSGRTDLMFYVSLPDYKARREIFELELKKRPCSEDIDLAELAMATPNFTCSDLSFVVKECARRCFDETITSGASCPIPISQSKILDVIKSTHSSVSEDEIKSYKDLKDKMEHRNEKNNRPIVGFSTNL